MGTAVEGRSVTVYEEVHPRRRLGACRVHERFVKRLAQREPWLPTRSPALPMLSAAAIVNLYGQRMPIEQAFRDTKNAALGAGLARSGSRGAAQAQRMQLQLMSNNRKTRAEVSVVTVGRRVVRNPWPYRHRLREQARAACDLSAVPA